MVRVLGDLTGLGKSFDQAKGKAGDTARSVSSSIGQMLSTLNQGGILGPFGESLATANQAFGELAETGRHVGAVMAGLGGAFVGVGTGLAILGSKDQAARQQLQAAIDATGRSWDDYSTRVEEAIKHNEKFGDSASVTQNALQTLVQATGDPAKALDLLGEAADLAAAKHESLGEAATQLGKVYNGSTKILKEFGITVTNTAAATKAADAAARQAATADRQAATAKQRLADLETIDAAKKHLTVTETVRLHDAQLKANATTVAAAAAHQKATQATQAATKATGGLTAVQQVGQKVAGQADAQSNTFTGHLKALTTEIEDQAAAFGNKYGPALQVAGQAFAVIGGTVEVGRKLLEKYTATTKAATAGAEAQTAANEAEQLSFDGLAVSAGGADVALLPIIATTAGIVLAVAALGAAAYVIYRNWDTIWKAMKAAVVDTWDWIRSHWPLLLAILTGPIGLAALEVVRHWQGVVDFFRGLPRQIGGFFLGVAEAIVWPFRTAFNDIADLWNRSVGSLSFHIPSWVPFVGGDAFSMPRIPHLAQGGLITQTGLVYAHAGEAITPIDKAPRGPVVAIANAHFSSDVDVEAFMRRVAWTVQTQRI
jgi:hypothetical protein